MTTTMKDLPEELTSTIIKSIKHEPIYKVKLTHVYASIYIDDDGDPCCKQEVEKVEKLITLTGNEEDAKKNGFICSCEHTCRCCYFDNIEKNDEFKFPAYYLYNEWVEGTGKVEKIGKTTDFLTRGRTWKMRVCHTESKVIIIEDLERVA